MASYAAVAVPLQGAATPVTTPTPGHTWPDAAAGVSDSASPVPRTRITRPRYVRRRRRTASNLRPADPAGAAGHQAAQPGQVLGRDRRGSGLLLTLELFPYRLEVHPPARRA